MKHTVSLPDYLGPGLRIIFVGINPGIRSAQLGHHFAGHSNRFWKLLYRSGLVQNPITCHDDWRLPEWGLGLTNIISRASPGIDVLKSEEYRAGRARLVAKIRRHRPRMVALLGVTIYRMLGLALPASSTRLGLQPVRLAGVPVCLLPNPSGRNAHYSFEEMVEAFRTLKQLADEDL